jgi:hypothetical protein
MIQIIFFVLIDKFKSSNDETEIMTKSSAISISKDVELDTLSPMFSVPASPNVGYWHTVEKPGKPESKPIC